MIGAVDIGGTKLAVGVVDENGVVRSKMDAPTGTGSTYASGLENITNMLRQTAQEARDPLVLRRVGNERMVGSVRFS